MPRNANVDADRTSRSVQRRTVVKGVGSLLGVGAFASAGGAANAGRASSKASLQGGPSYGLEQTRECVSLSPIVGDAPVEEFYRYDAGGTRYSSVGSITGLERERTSRLLLYRGPEDVLSLVVVHGKHYIEDVPEGGGSVSLTFEGLPADGEWVVRDDSYDGPNLYDEWEIGDGRTTAHWTWQGGRTDGGVFAGLGDDFSVTIEPAFNGDAKLYEQHYDGDMEAWEAVGGSQADPNIVSLAMDEPVVIRSGGCQG